MAFPKSKLKNMFLLKLEEYSKSGSGVSYGADTIIASLSSGQLTADEKTQAWEGFEELKLEGLIMQDPSQRHSSVFTKLTTKGNEHIETIKKRGLDCTIPSVRLADVISDERLLERCKTAFNNDEFWDAVTNATRHLEVRVRDASGIRGVTGSPLMGQAFDKDRGPLIITAALDDEQKEGFKLILMGMMKFHRNQKAHFEGELERKDAIRILGYINYLLEVIDTAEKRT